MCSGSWVSKWVHQPTVGEEHKFSGVMTSSTEHQEIWGQDVSPPFLPEHKVTSR